MEVAHLRKNIQKTAKAISSGIPATAAPRTDKEVSNVNRNLPAKAITRSQSLFNLQHYRSFQDSTPQNDG